MAVQSRQQYVTANNRLLQSVGASKLLDDIMDWWLEELPESQRLYVGGGNAAARFDSVADARAAIGGWSRKWVRKAPGARLVAGVGVHDNEWQAFDCADKDLEREKEEGSFGLELGALPVTRYCPDTGLAASQFHVRDKEWKSAEAITKEDRAREYDDELHASGGEAEPVAEGHHTRAKIAAYREILGDRYRFPVNLEDLGMREAERQVAVVHCDGNGIGKIWRDLAAGKTGELQAGVFGLSNKLADTARGAMHLMLRDLVASLSKWEKDEILSPRSHGGERRYLPIRPLIDSGDDVTWICSGRLGIGSAARFCEHFAAISAGKFDKPLSACGGVAIVPVGFPFRRAYELADGLCKAAKEKRRSDSSKQGFIESGYIDYQIVMEGGETSVDKIRGKYRKSTVKRPFSLRDEWPVCEERWKHFKSEWEGRGRGRAKSLFEAIASGSNRGKGVAELYAQQGYHGPSGTPDDWFEALELIDFHAEWLRDTNATP